MKRWVSNAVLAVVLVLAGVLAGLAFELALQDAREEYQNARLGYDCTTDSDCAARYGGDGSPEPAEAGR